MAFARQRLPLVVASAVATLLLAAMPTGTAVAAQAVGSVVVATGAVSAVDPDGTPRILAKGSPVYPGDVVITASKSLCVLSMIDGAKVSVRAESEIEIEEYQFEGTESDSSVVELVKGGFRAVTGIIGQQNPEAYKVNSSLSVLGIRGTEYLTRMCIVTDEGNPCEREIIQLGGEQRVVPEGQYVFVTEGGMYMQTEIDRRLVDIDLAAGEVGFASREALRILPTVPDFLLRDPTPLPGSVSDDAAAMSDFEGCRI